MRLRLAKTVAYRRRSCRIGLRRQTHRSARRCPSNVGICIRIRSANARAEH